MRPLRIQMQAFGPFAGSQDIDFRCLAGRSFFLVHGPTGAGKSSILDAMCFALYGETSGNERDGRQMRSHHAAPDCETRVTFWFLVGSKAYRVERSPQQERPRQRGEGDPIRVQPKATLWRTDSGRDELVATGVAEVTQATTDLLGFRADQFRQVVVLPQGQFRRLLSSNTRERQEILAALFGTARYRRLEAALKERAALLERALAGHHQRRDELLERLAASTESEVADRIADEARELEAQEAIGQALAGHVTQARVRLEAGRAARLALDEVDAARGQVEALRQAQADIDSAALVLATARRAGMLAEAVANRDERARDAVAADGNVVTARDAETQLRSELEAATQGVQAQEARAPEREAAAGDLARLEAMREDVRGFCEASDLVAVATRVAAQRDNALREARERRVAAEAAREQARLALEGAISAAAMRDGLAQRLALSRGRLQERTRLATRTRELEQAQTALAQAVEREADLALMHRDALAALVDAERRWRSGQAAVLARELVSGEPCPVCGAVEHPQPAGPGSAGPEALPTPADLEDLRRAADGAADARRIAGEAVAGLRGQVEALRSALAEARADLGEDAALDVATLAARVAEDQVALERAQTQAQAQDDLKRALTQAQEALGQADAAVEVADQAATGARADLLAAQARFADRGERVPAALRSAGALEAALASQQAQVRALQQALDDSRDRRDQAARAHAAAAAVLEQAVTAARTAAHKAEAARSALHDRMMQAGFADESALKTALRTGAEMDAIEGTIGRHAQAVATSADRLRRAEASAVGLQPPDLAALAVALQEAEEARRAHDEAVGGRRVALATRRGFAAELDQVLGAVRRQEEEYAVMGRLARVAGGTNSLNLTLERYVLAALLDDVLLAASRRLAGMSQGRYELRRADRLADGRRAGGLDLEVLDAHTGCPRSVATLSGGEGFLASLALALGLADVVQAQAGGIRLEAIFVDEGFGSLDSEVLDRVLDTLQELQTNGRLVGIISHVPELKEAIDVRLEITTGPAGSRARFVVPDGLAGG